MNRYEEEWVIYNGAYGIADTVVLGRIEESAEGAKAWLDVPYDMVGPFDYDLLREDGVIHFAACMVMSRQKWREDQDELREEALHKRREAQREMFEELHRYNQSRQQRYAHAHMISEREHRIVLELPVEGVLKPLQIKAAFRKLAKISHPDVGGSHEEFIAITEAKDALLERC